MPPFRVIRLKRTTLQLFMGVGEINSRLPVGAAREEEELCQPSPLPSGRRYNLI
jgi:hypothetical protein